VIVHLLKKIRLNNHHENLTKVNLDKKMNDHHFQEEDKVEKATTTGDLKNPLIRSTLG